MVDELAFIAIEIYLIDCASRRLNELLKQFTQPYGGKIISPVDVYDSAISLSARICGAVNRITDASSEENRGDLNVIVENLLKTKKTTDEVAEFMKRVFKKWEEHYNDA